MASVESNARLLVLLMKQDDPKKCTSAKLFRMGYAEVIHRPSSIRSGIIVLDPFAEQVLLPADRQRILTRGLCVVDCSWERAQRVFSRRLSRWSRSLPLVLAGNPVNYGQLGKLSSLEAFVAALKVVGLDDQAEQITGLYKWGPTFLTLNENPLLEYARAGTQEEVRNIEQSYFGSAHY